MSAHVKRILVTAVGVVGIGGCWQPETTTTRIPLPTATTTSVTSTTSADPQQQQREQQVATQQEEAARLQDQAAQRQLQAAQRQEQAARAAQQAEEEDMDLAATQLASQLAAQQLASQQAAQEQARDRRSQREERAANEHQQQGQQGQRPDAFVEGFVAGSQIRVSKEIADECQLDVDNMARSPKFETDRSYVLSNDRQVLLQIATCTIGGALKGQRLELIGRTDPRGSAQYNVVLGAERAAQVGDTLMGLGVPSHQVSTISKGKDDAMGTSEAGWAQ